MESSPSGLPRRDPASDPGRKTEDEVFEEYLERINGGEPLDRGELRSLYPELAERLIAELELYEGIQGAPPPEEPLGANGVLGTVGDYTLRRQIGRGGMGVVYEAWQSSMDRRVALKVLPRAIAVDTRAVARFIQEAQLAGRLSHPNIVHVHGMGVEEQVPYFSMEHVEGETLAQIVTKLKQADESTVTPFGKRGELAFYSNLASLFADVADGLQHAHSHKIIHRDIKPSNLILDREGRLRILDFGLARLEGQESITLSGDFVGTPQYMSPEQARRKKIPIDHRTDIYSLGTTLYEMLTLEPPFRGKDHADTLSQIMERDPSPPSRINPRVPKNLETIVLKCLRKEAGDRYGTAEALGQDLRRFARGDAIETRAEARWERWIRRLQRERQKIALAFLGLLLVIAIGFALLASWRQARGVRLVSYRTQVQQALKELESSQMTIIDPGALEFEGVSMIQFSGEAGRSKMEAAIRLLGEASALCPDLPDAWYHRGKAMTFLGRLPEALADLKSAIASDSSFLPPRILKAIILSNQGDSKAAKAEIEAAGKATGGDSADIWLRLHKARRSSAWAEEADLFSRLIDLEERGLASYRDAVYDTRLGRGIAHEHLQDYKAAVRDFAVAQSRWPDSNEPAACLGEAYYRGGDKETASSVFEDLYRRAAVPSQAATIIAATYHGLKDFPKCLEWTRLVSDEVVADRLRIEALGGLGKTQDALDAAKRVLQKNPEDHMALREMGLLLWGEGKSVEAEEFLRRALRIDPTDQKARHYLGTSLYDQKKYVEAREQYEKVLERSPQHGYAHSAIACVLFEEGKLSEAKEWAKKAIEILPFFHESHALLARIYASEGSVSEAIAELETAIHVVANAGGSDLANAHGLAGRVYLDLGILDRAGASFREALRLNPRHGGAKEGLTALAKRRQELEAHRDAVPAGKPSKK